MTDRPSAFHSGIKCMPSDESRVLLLHNSVKSSDEILTELFSSFNAKPPDSLVNFDSLTNKSSSKHHKKIKKHRPRHLSHKHKRKPKSKKSKKHKRMSSIEPKTCTGRPDDIADNCSSRPTSVNSEETCFDKKSMSSCDENNFVSVPILNQEESPKNSYSKIEVVQQEVGVLSLNLELDRPSSVSSTPSRPNSQHSISVNSSADTTIVHITDRNTDEGLRTNDTLVTCNKQSSNNTMLVENKENTSSVALTNAEENEEFNLLRSVTDVANTKEVISPVGLVVCEGHLGQGLETKKEETPSTEVINEMVKVQKSKSVSRERSRSPVKKQRRSKERSPEQGGHKRSSKRLKHRNRSKSHETDHPNTKNGKCNKAKNDNHGSRKKRSRSRDIEKDRRRRSRSVQRSAHLSDRKKNRSSSRDRKARVGDKKRRSKSCDGRIRHEVNHNKGREGSGYHRDKGKRSRSRSRERRKRSISRERSSDRKNAKKRKGRSVSIDRKTQRKSRDRSRSSYRKKSTSVDRGSDRKRKSASLNRCAEEKIENESRERSPSRSKSQAGESHVENLVEQVTATEPENPEGLREIRNGSQDIDVPKKDESISPAIDKVEEQGESHSQVSLQIDSKDSLNTDLDSIQSKTKDQVNNLDEDKCKIEKKKSHKNNRKSRSKSPIKDSHQRDRKQRSKSNDSYSHHSRPKRKSRSRSHDKDNKKNDKRRRSKSKDVDNRRSDRKSRSKSRSRHKSNKIKKGKSKDRDDNSKKKTRSKSKDANTNRKSRSKSRDKGKSSHRTEKRSRSKSQDKDKGRHRGDKRSRSKSLDKDKSSHRTDLKRSRSKSLDKDKSRHRSDKRSRSKSRDKDKSRHRTDKKSRSKSRDKDKSSHRTDKRSRSKSLDKDKDSHRTDKRSRSKSLDKDKSSHRTDLKRSRSKSRDKDKSRHRTDKKSRSKSRDRSRRNVRKRRSRSREVRIDKRKLFEIARKNAMSMLKQAAAPFGTENLVTIKAGGKSVEELTDFCKQLSKKEAGVSTDSEDGDDTHHSDSDIERPFHHPFQLKERPTNIVLNIRNSVSVPTKTFQEKTAEQSKQLRLQFPVSSGSNHRKTESEWVPVASGQPSTSVPLPSSATLPAGQTSLQPASTAVPSTVPSTVPAGAQADTQSNSSVFPPAPASPPDIGNIVEKRVNAMRKLTANPNDSHAISQIYQVNQQMSMWLASKQQPGQFTGSTGAKVLTVAQLGTGYQAWAKKDQLMTAAPVSGGMGMALLQKMGWRPGEGLGKNKEGSLEPLKLEVKMDKKGLVAQEELSKKHQSSGRQNSKSLGGKHPVSLLVEFCSKRHWDSPQFHVCFECGPDHKKNFLFKVRVNGMEYQPSVASNNKKQAKAEAARLCLQTLGLLYPDTPK